MRFRGEWGKTGSDAFAKSDHGQVPYDKSIMRAVFLALSFTLLAYSQPPPGRPPLRDRAAAGDPDAQFTLGKNYEAGRGGLKVDYKEAARWYEKSAEQGNIYAQASLGILYRAGKGVARDNLQAEVWFMISAEHAPEGDRDTIAEMRDSVAAHLTAAQIEEAKREAKAWKPKQQP